MRRINVTIDNARITKSFKDKEELNAFLWNNCGFKWLNKNEQLSNAIWDLDVGDKLKCDGLIFSIQSKQRIGSQLYDGSTIGK